MARPTAEFFGKEQMPAGGGTGIGVARSSILNFKPSVVKHKLRDKHFDVHREVKDKHKHEDDFSKNAEKKMKEIDMKIERECHNCRNGCKENHIIELAD